MRRRRSSTGRPRRGCRGCGPRWTKSRKWQQAKKGWLIIQEQEANLEFVIDQNSISVVRNQAKVRAPQAIEELYRWLATLSVNSERWRSVSRPNAIASRYSRTAVFRALAPILLGSRGDCCLLPTPIDQAASEDHFHLLRREAMLRHDHAVALERNIIAMLDRPAQIARVQDIALFEAIVIGQIGED